MLASPPENEARLSAHGLPGLSVEDTNSLRDATVRRHVTYLVVGAFVFVNVLTYVGIGWIYHDDQVELGAKIVAPSQRIITTGIVGTAVGATTVQLGFIAVLIGRFLFPRAGDGEALDEDDPLAES